MGTTDHTTRRRLLGLTGATATAALLAGCGGPEEGDDPGRDEETGNGQDADVGADDVPEDESDSEPEEDPEDEPDEQDLVVEADDGED